MTLARPSPYTWTVGDIVTAALLNGVRDALTWSQNPPVFLGTQSAVQSVTSGSWAPLSIDTTQIDSYNGHSNTTNNSRWTCPNGAAGWYLVVGSSCWAVNSSGSRTARIAVNGSAVVGSGALLAPGTLNASIATIPRPIYLNVGDYVECYGGQNSGSTLSTAVTTEAACTLACFFIHA